MIYEIGALVLELQGREFPMNEIVGCQFDWMSNLVLFTRNGTPIGNAFYVGPDVQSCKCTRVVPTVYVSPKCKGGKDLVLPMISLQFNFGQSEFRYKYDLKKRSLDIQSTLT